MRLSMMVLTIAIGSAVAVHRPAEAGLSSKLIKNKAHSIRKTVVPPIDVWARIRSGLKIPFSIAVNTAEPANKGTAGSKDAAIHPRFSAVATKIRKNADGIPFLSKPPPNGAPKRATAPALHRYTELGRAKLGPHRYTEFGGKLLGVKTSVTVEIDCTSPPSVRRPKAQGREADRKMAWVRLKEPMKFGNAHPGFRQKHGSEAAVESVIRRNKVKALLSKPIHAGESIKMATPCPGPQLAANEDSFRQKRKANLSGKQEGRAGQQNNQAAINARINKFVAAYTRNPDFLYRVAKRAHPYLYHIVETLSQYRLPLELALLPIVESAYQPTAKSPKNARGLWQFIPSTGMDYNLVQRHDYDERLDIPKSTQAAILYLTGLNNHFNGDWLLALAAYNSGQATVDNAISNNRAEGFPADFWALDLPEETQDYVPRLLALSKIVARPADYGIKLPPIQNEPHFVKVSINREFDVNYLADKDISMISGLADLPYDQFRTLNPGYLGSTLSRKRSYIFLMPLANADLLRRRLASVAQFMAEPVLPLKSVIRKEKSEAYPDFSGPAFSWFSESTGASKFAIPFLSLSMNDEKAFMGQTLI